MKDFDEIKGELEGIRAKKEANKNKRSKPGWYGLVWCNSSGWASIIGEDCKGIWLGKTREIIPYLKSRHMDGENVDMVLQAVRQLRPEEEPKPYERPRFSGMDGYVPLPPYQPVKANVDRPRESESQSYHLATNNNTPSMVRRKNKSNRITLKEDPLFLASLDELISKGYGNPTIQRELRTRGYNVPYATLGRWVKKRRDTTGATSAHKTNVLRPSKVDVRGQIRNDN